ncbi:MAG: aminotransferase class V-fold PLP-dependent enzyme [Chlamydiales bacterium]|nr:aminotransferase class V-fold PLP-dependent enzyme [Chlamydiales bacterium]
MNFHSHVGRLPTAAVPDCTEALKNIYDLVGAGDDYQFTYAPSRAHAISHVLYSYYFDEITETGRNHYLTISGEDAPIVLTLDRLEKAGCFGKKCAYDEIDRYITPRTGLVTLSWANTLTGVIHPIEKIAKICQEKGVALHVDASPVIGKLSIQLRDLPIDYLTIDQGVFTRPGIALGPLVCGEPLDPHAILNLGARAKSLIENLDEVGCEGVRLRDIFERRLVEAIPSAKILFADRERLPGISAVAFPSLHAELLAFHLHHRGIGASFGGGAYQTLENILAGHEHASSALSFCIQGDASELILALQEIV